MTETSLKIKASGGARLAHSVERATLDLGLMSLSPTLGVEVTLETNKQADKTLKEIKIKASASKHRALQENHAVLGKRIN